MCELCASVLTWFYIKTVCLKSPPYVGSPALDMSLAAKVMDYIVCLVYVQDNA